MDFSPRSPASKTVLTMDFTTRLGSLVGASAVWTVLDQTGTTSYPAMLLGSVDISSLPIVRQQIQGATDSTTYLHRCEVTTTDGQVVVGDVYQTVRSGA